MKTISKNAVTQQSDERMLVIFDDMRNIINKIVFDLKEMEKEYEKCSKG